MNRLLTSNFRKIAASTVTVCLFLLLTTGALAQTVDPTRPGWGHGDQNHEHVGPPGQSVLPVNGGTYIGSETNIGVSANTGGNVVQGNKGGAVTIVTGAVSAVVSFVSSVGYSLFGS